MSEKKSCSLCSEFLEEPPAIHDLVLCEKTELVKGRIAIEKLKISIDEWKDAWFSLRDIIGKLSWVHSNCHHEIKPAMEQPPNSWLHMGEEFVQKGKLAYAKTSDGWELIGAGASEAAAEAVVKLMQMKVETDTDTDTEIK